MEKGEIERERESVKEDRVESRYVTFDIYLERFFERVIVGVGWVGSFI